MLCCWTEKLLNRREKFPPSQTKAPCLALIPLVFQPKKLILTKNTRLSRFIGHLFLYIFCRNLKHNEKVFEGFPINFRIPYLSNGFRIFFTPVRLFLMTKCAYVLSFYCILVEFENYHFLEHLRYIFCQCLPSILSWLLCLSAFFDTHGRTYKGGGGELRCRNFLKEELS